MAGRESVTVLAFHPLRPFQRLQLLPAFQAFLLLLPAFQAFQLLQPLLPLPKSV
jgi:hypothetical protein